MAAFGMREPPIRGVCTAAGAVFSCGLLTGLLPERRDLRLILPCSCVAYCSQSFQIGEIIARIALVELAHAKRERIAPVVMDTCVRKRLKLVEEIIGVAVAHDQNIAVLCLR